MAKLCFSWKYINDQQGLTLIEMLFCLVLVSMVASAGFSLYSSMASDWQSASAQSPVLSDTRLAMEKIASDIRAADKPNSDTRAVRVLVPQSGDTFTKGQRLDVYQYDDASSKYMMIEYRLVKNNAADSYSHLQRGWVESSSPSTDANPSYGNITNWRTILDGVTSSVLFEDALLDDDTDTSNDDNERRIINVDMKAADTLAKPRFRDFELKYTIASRSQQIGVLSGGAGGGSTIIPVASVAISPHNPATVPWGGDTVTLSAAVSPGNSSNKGISWTDNSDWIHIVGSGTNIQIDVDPNPEYRVSHHWVDSSPRQGTVTVTTDDGHFTDTITIHQSGSS
ncbi:MAG TPA: prepilin-type N-terminal cleavage/methylation domain-containing protein [Syntrophomonadaceae bacterium]|nr:prepilin-type N-terminal cleavage/methylation domain-containing protein [Syntrophomonadaceae bacterium]